MDQEAWNVGSDCIETVDGIRRIKLDVDRTTKLLYYPPTADGEEGDFTKTPYTDAQMNYIRSITTRLDDTTPIVCTENDADWAKGRYYEHEIELLDDKDASLSCTPGMCPHRASEKNARLKMISALHVQSATFAASTIPVVLTYPLSPALVIF